jgi:N-acetyltransferase
MQISLGQEVQKKCKTCGMEYIQSSAEDRKLHDKYHKQNTEGYDVGKDFVQKARPHSTFEGVRKGDKICQLICFDRPARKKRGQAALEVVQRELGAVEIPEKAIWDPNECSSHTDADYDAYLYIRGTKCIGVLLTQRIKEAYMVMEPVDSYTHLEEPQESKQKSGCSARDALRARQEVEAKRLEELSKRPIELSKDTTPAIFGISRIWTSATHRHSGIGSMLLDTAFAAHNARMAERARVDTEMRAQRDMHNENHERLERQVNHLMPPVPRLESKDDVAFSQPTEAGTRLARRWFGKMFGWKVYVD